MQSLFFSTIAGASTAIGAIILMITGSPGKKLIAALLGFAAGVMVSVSVFELMPTSLEMGSLLVLLVGFLLGCGLMFSLDLLVPHAHLSQEDCLECENVERLKTTNQALRTGYLIFLGIALHNVPEGLAIGAGLKSSPALGLSIALAIGMHNVPEGLAVAGPLKAGGMGNMKVLLFTLAAGLMTPIGTLIGLAIFSISPAVISGSLSFAAGAMMYIVNDELIPQANSQHNHSANLGFILGLLIAYALI